MVRSWTKRESHQSRDWEELRKELMLGTLDELARMFKASQDVMV